MSYSKEKIINQIKELGIKRNDIILIHSSMKAIGEVENGAETILDAFTQYLNEGLLIFPTHTWATINEKNNIFDPLKIDYYLLRSAVFAEMFYPGYERYFFKLSSESLPSWASFHGKELEMRRLNNISRIEDYIGVWEQKVIFSKYSYLPRIIFKISTFVTVMKSIIPLEVKKTMENIKELVIAVRVTKMHRTKYYSVLRASVIVEANSEKPLEDLIRANCTLIALSLIHISEPTRQY